MKRDRLDGRPAPRLLLAAAVLCARTAFPACGDGVLDAGEDCDDGNVVAGDCCSPSCAFEAEGGACPDDGNPCSLDVCDAAGTCTHPTGGQAACDDGDPCTTGDVCGDGVCRGTFTLDGCVDAVFCHRAKSVPPIVPLAVRIDDQVALPFGTLSRPRDLCLPATTTGGALLTPDVALDSLTFRGASGLKRIWHVTDAFGSFDLETTRIDRLLVATATNAGSPPPGPPAPGSANHYACRRVVRPGSPDLPHDIPVTVDDALGTEQRIVLRPQHLCSPADVAAPATGMPHPRAHLMCYRLERTPSPPSPILDVDTANQLGTGELQAFNGRELCLPASAEEPASPCLTSRDECGLPCCRVYPGQHADCTFDPPVPAPRYRGCSGPTILVDRSHVNFHEVTSESALHPGRYWGFAKLLVRDGYVVRDSAVPFADLLPSTTAKIIVIANPQALLAAEAIPAADVTALVDWVEAGGSLLLSIDHPPFEKAGALLSALGLVRSGSTAKKRTFTRASGDLNGSSAIANGFGPGDAIDEVTTFTGTAFSIAPSPPAGAVYEAVLTLPPDAEHNLGGFLQAVTIELGAGRVYVSGESGGLTAQDGFGMQFTPDNEQYLLNIIHWLDD